MTALGAIQVIHTRQQLLRVEQHGAAIFFIRLGRGLSSDIHGVPA
jgi:hypothetical protein